VNSDFAKPIAQLLDLALRIPTPESNLITADVGKPPFFADRVANLFDFSLIKANLGSLLKNVFGIFKTNMWTFKVF
jgi:hypothetical protein